VPDSSLFVDVEGTDPGMGSGVVQDSQRGPDVDDVDLEALECCVDEVIILAAHDGVNATYTHHHRRGSTPSGATFSGSCSISGILSIYGNN